VGHIKWAYRKCPPDFSRESVLKSTRRIRFNMSNVPNMLRLLYYATMGIKMQPWSYIVSRRGKQVKGLDTQEHHARQPVSMNLAICIALRYHYHAPNGIIHGTEFFRAKTSHSCYKSYILPAAGFNRVDNPSLTLYGHQSNIGVLKHTRPRG
jgi:hypothetical protein